MIKNRQIPDLLHLHFIVILLGFTGILGKLISLPALEMVWYRMMLAFIALFLWLLFKHSLSIPGKRDIVKYLATGIIVAMHWVAFFGSIKTANVSVALACFASTALFTSLLEPLFNKARVSKLEISLGIVIIIALYLIFQFETRYTLGIIFGIISAVLGALFMVINKNLQLRERPLIITMYEMLGGFMALSLFIFIYGFYHPVNLNPQWSDIFWLLILAFLCTAYAFMASIKVMRSLSAYQVVLTINLEPVYGILMAFIIFADTELMTPGFYMGSGIILLAVFSYSFYKRYKSKYITNKN